MLVNLPSRLGDAAAPPPELSPDDWMLIAPDTPPVTDPALNQQTAPTAADAPAWWDVWGQLNKAAADLDAATAALEKNRAYALSRANLAQDFLDREQELQTAKERLTWIRDAIKSVLGFFGVQLQGLGFIPLITIGVAAAAVAYIVKQAADTWALSKKIDEQQRLEAKGLTPTAASKIVAGEVNAGSFTQTLTSAKGLIVAVTVLGSLYVGYKIAKRAGLL